MNGRRRKAFSSSSSSSNCNLFIEPLVSEEKLMEQELKQELFLRAEELERLIAVYKLKLCGEERSSLNYDTNQLLEKRFTDVWEEQRGQFYDLYMNKREMKLREEWKTKGAKKEAEMRTMMESLASTSSRMMRKEKVIEPNNEHSRQTSSRKSSSSSTIPTSTSQNSEKAAHNPTIRSTNSASLRKENTKPLKGTGKEVTPQRSIVRSKSSSDRTGLVKEIRASRSQSLRKNSASLGEPKDFMPMDSNLSRNGATDPLVMKKIGTAKLRISMASLVEDQVEESSEMLKEVNGHFESVYDPSEGGSHNMNDGKAGRVRKKWGSVERPFSTVDTITRSTTHVTKGIKRFLKLGEKSRVAEIHNNKDDDNDLYHLFGNVCSR